MLAAFTLLAAFPSGIAGIAVWIIIVAAVAAIVFVAVRAMGLQIPPWVLNIVWIVLIAVVAIVAIKFLVSV